MFVILLTLQVNCLTYRDYFERGIAEVSTLSSRAKCDWPLVIDWLLCFSRTYVLLPKEKRKRSDSVL